ncbi:hypothetical protein [Thiothrix eikelboomii]|uniref:Ankyrin repeat-containing protein n=1 Tax=Thiothrix eikelboomii TaxID=92487 RepID=A0A1T4VXP3_9GAMM|nr:hypothetical protein [Thiothrix eikelboomii]SKA69261.1 Ankyrin repeat-containing protein [Thiothrix eikelboomii]
MNKYSFKLVIRFSSIVFLLVFGCVNYLHAEERVKYLSGQKNILNNKQIRLLDTHAANALSACDFIYTGAPIGNIAGDMIYKCIESADHWFYSNGYKNIGLSDKQIYDFHGQSLNIKMPSGLPDEQLRKFHILDDYLGNKLLPYILAMSRIDQAKLLRKIAFFYSDNLVFIQTMINKGVSVKDVLLRQIGEGGALWAPCEAYHLFLKQNIKLYKDNKTLYEPIPDFDGKKGINSSYRWEDLHHLSDHTYNVCPEAIEKLARANSALLNKRQSYGGVTPLHLYLSGLDVNIELVSKLLTSANINMKTSLGNTPLHEFLINNKGSTNINQQIIKMMIVRGANINIKNNKGVTVKDLILKHPGLSGFFK